MFNFLLLFLIFSWTLQAGSLPLQRLAWQMEGGDVRSIAGLCREYVQKKLEAEKTFSLESLLRGPGTGAGLPYGRFLCVGREGEDLYPS